jgi:hypothetical protein
MENYEPVIGVIANLYPDDDDNTNKAYIYNTHLISIEENGGRVVPILPWYSQQELDELLSKLNGVLMQGGSRNLNLSKPFEEMNKYVLDYVINHNLKYGNENPFPLLCTCQGIELLYALLYKNVEILSKFKSWNYFIPMKIMDDQLIKKSKFFHLFNEEDFNIFTSKPSTVHLHNYGIDLDYHKKFSLSKEYQNLVDLQILTYAQDREGKSFVGNVEDSRLNIFASIFHPEQMPYNYCLEAHPEVYNSESARINIKLEKAFVEISKLSKNRINEKEAEKFKIIKDSKRLNFIVSKMSEEDYEYEFMLFEK